jgi:hypothetical protein
MGMGQEESQSMGTISVMRIFQEDMQMRDFCLWQIMEETLILLNSSSLLSQVHI